MKHILLFLIGWLPLGGAWAQDKPVDSLLAGTVTHLSAQNVYVRFTSTKGINIGDTLYLIVENQRIPVLIVAHKSSISVVGEAFPGTQLKTEDKLLTRLHAEAFEAVKPKVQEVVPTNKEAPLEQNLSKTEKPKPDERVQKIEGRIGLSSNSGIGSNTSNSHRFRYTASLNAEHLANSRFSFESYLAFTHRAGEWAEVQENTFNALKIYSLAAQAEIGTKNQIWLGRKINPKISNVGAVDGVQTESHFGNFSAGGLLGSRPDYKNYSFNPSLFEYGAFLSHEVKEKQGRIQSSAAFFEQKNGGHVDRRFAYFQHDNSLVRNLNLFISGEVDLYKVQEGTVSTQPSLTSLYVSARYRFNRKLSLSTSYDARKNVIYYETFKDYADKLLEDATRQGLQLRINYRPVNYVTVGLSGGYRVRETDLKPNQNVQGFISLSRIPWINSSLTANANFLSTSYFQGQVISLRLYKDLVPGKLMAGLSYRFVDYTFSHAGSVLKQHNIQTNISFQISKLTSLSADYELSFDESLRYHRIYINFVQRFK